MQTLGKHNPPSRKHSYITKNEHGRFQVPLGTDTMVKMGSGKSLAVKAYVT